MELVALVEQARAGNLDAFDTLVRRFQDMALGYAYSLLGDFHLAEDASQEAFLGAYGNLSQLRNSAAFVTWFRRILFRQCHQLRRKLHFDTVPIDSVHGIVSDTPDPDQSVETHAMRDEIQNLIKTLPKQEAQTITLFYISEYSQAEVAAFLGVSVDTVKNRLRNGRSKIKERMLKMAKHTLRNQAPSRDDSFATVVSLCNAAQAGDAKRVEHLLATNPKLATQPISQNDQLAIQFAAREGHVDVVRLLLEAGADPLKGVYPNRKATSALAFARDRGHNRVVKVIEDYLTEHPQEKAEPGEGDALMAAVKEGNVATVRMVLDSDASLASHPARPLKEAAIKGNLDIVRLMLDHGADPDEPYEMDLGDEGVHNNAGEPLWLAAHHNHYEVCELLLERGADPNVYVFASGPAAERAMENDNEAILNLIYRYGGVGFADAAALCGQIAVPAEVMHLQPEKAPRMLWGAALGGNMDLAKLCLRFDLKSADWFDLMYQPLRGPRNQARLRYMDGKRNELEDKVEILRMMLEHGADPNLHDERQVGLLHRLLGETSLWEDEEKVLFADLLIDYGAEIDARDGELRSTPLGYAARYGLVNMVRFLLERGAKTNLAADEPWATPLAWAEKMGYKEIADLLRKHGATA